MLISELSMMDLPGGVTMVCVNTSCCKYSLFITSTALVNARPVKGWNGALSISQCNMTKKVNIVQGKHYKGSDEGQERVYIKYI